MVHLEATEQAVQMEHQELLGQVVQVAQAVVTEQVVAVD
jgi:hypothetical protein